MATDFVSDVLLSLNLLVFIRDDTSYVRSDPNFCLFILSASCSATSGGEQIVLPTRMFLFKAAKGTMTV